MIKVTSKDNLKLKEYRKLCSSKRYRVETNRFALEGVRLICDSLKSSAVIDELFVTEAGIKRLGENFAPLEAAAKSTLLITEELAKNIGETDSPQGAFAICKGSLTRDDLPKSAERGILMLCSLQDPGNVGTILRSAEAFGLSAVIMTGDCPDAASPKVLRASMGAALRIAVHRVSSAEEAVLSLQKQKISVYAAALGEKSISVDAVSLKGAAVMIGNEGSGLPDSLADLADKRVILPISEQSESLNAAMAATVFAWELSRAARNDA